MLFTRCMCCVCSLSNAFTTTAVHWKTLRLGSALFLAGCCPDRFAVAEAVEKISEDAVERAIDRAHTLLASAREGSKLLMSASECGFSTRAMCPSDWEYLVGLCDPDVTSAYHAMQSPFTEERLLKRRAVDAWVAALLNQYKTQCLPC